MNDTYYVGCTASEMMDKLGIEVFYSTKEGRIVTKNMFNVVRPSTFYEQNLYRQKLLQQLEACLD